MPSNADTIDTRSELPRMQGRMRRDALARFFADGDARGQPGRLVAGRHADGRTVLAVHLRWNSTFPSGTSSASSSSRAPIASRADLRTLAVAASAPRCSSSRGCATTDASCSRPSKTGGNARGATRDWKGHEARCDHEARCLCIYV